MLSCYCLFENDGSNSQSTIVIPYVPTLPLQVFSNYYLFDD